MAINYTSLLGLAQPVTGTESNTWGTVVNDEITALIEQAVAGGETINVTSADVTLTDIDGAPSQARNAILLISGTPGTTRNVIAPSQSKTYVVVNGSNAAVVIKGAATTGATIAAGSRSIVAWNGTDFVEVAASGDVDGPASSTDNALPRFDGTTGKLIQNSGVTIDDSNNVSGVVQLNATTVDTTNIEVTAIKAKDGTASATIADATGVMTIASSVLTTTDINGGTIDGATIGGANPAVGTFTTLNATTFNATNINTTTLDLTNLEVTNIKAKDGTASASIADSTGIFTHATATVFPAGTVSAPSITTTGDTNTGIYFPAADTIAFTEGGVEAMRINSSGLVGIGVTSVGFPLDIADISGENLRLRGNASTGSSMLQFSSSNAGANYGRITSDPNSLAFWYGVSERMRIDSSGNVGIGTSSPTARLYIYDGAGGTQVACIDGTGAPSLIFRSSGSQRGGIGQANGNVTGASASDFAVQANSNLLFAAGGTTERMRIDSAGNLGLGVTPSAWSTNTRAIQTGSRGSLSEEFVNSGRIAYSANAYATSSTAWAYVVNGAASSYQQLNGVHSWYTAPSSTAGNAITFTQAMTLDANGRLGLGTTSPTDGGLTITTSVTRDGDWDAKLALQSTGGNDYPTLLFSGCSATNRYGAIIQTASTSGASSAQIGAILSFPMTSATTCDMVFATSNNIGTAGATERARITSGGRLLVGTTTENASGGVLQVSNGITFPATQSASSDANTLDDYEEGTWTPDFGSESGSFGAITWIDQTGRYTKIGNTVTVWARANASDTTIGTASGQFIITGLPFVSNSIGSMYAGSGWRGGGSGPAILGQLLTANVTYFTPIKENGSAVAVSDLISGGRNDFTVTITYMV